MKNKTDIVSDVAIKVANLTKTYKIYNKPSDVLKEFVANKVYHQEFWALKDISFEVRKGEVVGIIGKNGAGKSTLLKILAGTLDKTSGTLNITGKISAILELGTGFQPEYTGRENIYMGALYLGMTREEVDMKIDSIISFSGLEDFIDRPFKTYSSGMQARLTFSTAVSIEPDILIIDEALAAGDAFFVGRCLSRISEICASGATVLFVSHSTGLVQRFCDRCIHIDKGSVIDIGDTFDVVSRYESLIIQELSQQYKQFPTSAVTKSDQTTDPPVESDDFIDLSSSLFGQNKHAVVGRGWVANGNALQINSICLYDVNDESRLAFYQHETMSIKVVVEAKKNALHLGIYLKIYRDDGILVTTWYSQSQELYNNFKDVDIGLHTITLLFKDLLFGDGVYYLSVLIYPQRDFDKPIQQAYAVYENKVCFEVKRKNPLSSVFDHPLEVYHNERRIYT
jgi:ABC-type polysaccharide/polyol phosphate transport system ATPase subunit